MGTVAIIMAKLDAQMIKEAREVLNSIGMTAEKSQIHFYNNTGQLVEIEETSGWFGTCKSRISPKRADKFSGGIINQIGFTVKVGRGRPEGFTKPAGYYAISVRNGKTCINLVAAPK